MAWWDERSGKLLPSAFFATAAADAPSASGLEAGAFKLPLHKDAVSAMTGVGQAPSASKRLFHVCLTGGPCSGKSSSLVSFTKALTSRGMDVYAIPETPTIVMNAGFPYPGLEGTEELLMEFELAIAHTQLQMENSAARLAIARDTLQRKRPGVIFYDRGLLDMKAYLNEAQWAKLLELLSLTEAQVQARYDLVIHLQTAAIGAEKFYTTANNAARTEGLEEARVNDARVKEAWAGHPNWHHVPNRPSGGFETKVAEATAAVLQLVGLAPA